MGESDSQQSLTVKVMFAAEKQILRDQAKSEGNKGKPKPANIIDKIISGRINKVSSLHARIKCLSALSTAAHHQQLTILRCGNFTILVVTVIHTVAGLNVTMHTITVSYPRSCSRQVFATLF